MKGSVDSDPVAKQYVPQMQELQILPGERLDPIGDAPHSPVKGLVHRHNNRVLFMPASACAVYCRYCFRREVVGAKGGKPADMLSATEIQDALDYIADNPQINEIILTGGDPLVLSARRLETLLEQLTAISSVSIVRIHTRVPVADPDRITDSMLDTLRKISDTGRPVYMVIHINHAQEINDRVRETLERLHQAGCVLLSQSVLLRGVNDCADTLAALCHALVELRVKPYYIHHPDLATGTAHFRLEISEGMQIMKDLRRLLTGIAMPEYMLDIPGGYGKVPLNHSYVEVLGDGRYLIEDPNGQSHHYPPE
jgi:lysine 2,3-aminomutase